MNLRSVSGCHTWAVSDLLLESKATTSVATTVQDVHEWDWEDWYTSAPFPLSLHCSSPTVWLLGSSEVGDVDVKRNALLSSSGLGDGHGNTKNGIGTELALVWCTVKLEEELVDSGLVLDIDVGLQESWSNDLVDLSIC